jgi:hypothetical protein
MVHEYVVSHLDDKRTGVIVVVMQRVHIDDLTDFLLAQSDEWDVLSLPAVADSDGTIPFRLNVPIAADLAKRCRPSASRLKFWTR